MTDTPKIPLERRVMPTIMATDIKGVSPLVGPFESIADMVKNQRELDHDKWDEMDSRPPGDTPSPVKTPTFLENYSAR